MPRGSVPQNLNRGPRVWEDGGKPSPPRDCKAEQAPCVGHCFALLIRPLRTENEMGRPRHSGMPPSQETDGSASR